MNTPGNGNTPNAGGNLPAPRPAAPVTSGAGSLADPAAAAVSPVQPDLARQARQERSRRQVRKLIVGAEYVMKVRVRHPDGGQRPVEDIVSDETAQRSSIESETNQGSRKHVRLPRWVRWIPKFVLTFDAGLLLYFFADITNVDWARPVSEAMAFALMLAGMVTVPSYGFLAFTGHRLRTHKNHEGTVHREEVDGLTQLACVAALVVITVLSLLMFLRMRTEVLYALGTSGVTAAEVVAAAVAVVSAAANFLVIGVHALDGSDQVARLHKLSADASRPAAKAHRMRRRAALRVDE